MGAEHGLLAALGAFIGHCYPVWLGFKGGKGVATYIGVLLGLKLTAGLAFCAIWLAVAVATRYSSLSALLASLATPALLWWLGKGRWRNLRSCLQSCFGGNIATTFRDCFPAKSRIGKKDERQRF
jgi:acyl phosphate:glycerol-3-phosphate acyltransferase